MRAVGAVPFNPCLPQPPRSHLPRSYHWDLPDYLQKTYGGFLGREIVSDFVRYADVVYDALSKAGVKKWMTFNEVGGGTRPGPLCTLRHGCRRSEDLLMQRIGPSNAVGLAGGAPCAPAAAGPDAAQRAWRVVHPAPWQLPVGASAPHRAGVQPWQRHGAPPPVACSNHHTTTLPVQVISICELGYESAVFAPGYTAGKFGKYRCGHHVLLAHAKVGWTSYGGGGGGRGGMAVRQPPSSAVPASDCQQPRGSRSWVLRCCRVLLSRRTACTTRSTRPPTAERCPLPWMESGASPTVTRPKVRRSRGAPTGLSVGCQQGKHSLLRACKPEPAGRQAGRHGGGPGTLSC